MKTYSYLKLLKTFRNALALTSFFMMLWLVFYVLVTFWSSAWGLAIDVVGLSSVESGAERSKGFSFAFLATVGLVAALMALAARSKVFNICSNGAFKKLVEEETVDKSLLEEFLEFLENSGQVTDVKFVIVKNKDLSSTRNPKYTLKVKIEGDDTISITFGLSSVVKLAVTNRRLNMLQMASNDSTIDSDAGRVTRVRHTRNGVTY